jgi:hypothetical protein
MAQLSVSVAMTRPPPTTSAMALAGARGEAG